MKKALVVSLVVALVLGISVSAQAKKMFVMNFDKGGMPNDSNNCDFSLSEEKAPKGQIYLKVTSTEAGKPIMFGEYAPKKANWEGYDVVRFDYFNEGKTPQALIFTIKPKGATYPTRMDAAFIARPGKGSVEIEIAGACGNGGTPIDWKTPLHQWYVNGPLSGAIHFGNITLETLEDDKPAKKEEKKKTE